MSQKKLQFTISWFVICHKGVLLTINIYFIIIIFEAKFMCLFTFDTNINFLSKYPEINVIDKQ